MHSEGDRLCRRVFLAGLFAAVAAAHGTAAAQADYPARTIRLVVPAPAGGPTDVYARLVAQQLSQSVGKPVVVDNIGGAAQTLGAGAVARAAPDGYTLLVTSTTPVVIAPHVMKSLPYTIKDFIPLTHMGTSALVLFVNNSVPASNLREFTKVVKESKDFAYGSYGSGSSAHLLAEKMAQQLGISMLHVPYKGITPQLTALIGGEIRAAVADVGSGAPFVASGKIKPLAVVGNKRSANFPDVATFSEQGVKGLELFAPTRVIFAPAGTPQAIVERLSAEFMKIGKSQEYQSKMRQLGVEPHAASLAETAAVVNEQYEFWGNVVKTMGNVTLQ